MGGSAGPGRICPLPLPSLLVVSWQPAQFLGLSERHLICLCVHTALSPCAHLCVPLPPGVRTPTPSYRIRGPLRPHLN